jgi:hypothetical protein
MAHVVATETHQSGTVLPPDNPYNYLRKLLGDRIESFSASANWFRRRHYFCTVLVAFLSATIAIIAGLNLPWLDKMLAKNWIVLLSTTSAAISTWGAFYSPREAWFSSSACMAELKALEAELDFSMASSGGKGVPPSELQRMFEKYQSILAGHNSRWRELKKKKA